MATANKNAFMPVLKKFTVKELENQTYKSIVILNRIVQSDMSGEALNGL